MGFDLHICWAPEATRSSDSRAGVSVVGELECHEEGPRR
jgi:hypothetical protein